YAGAAPTWTLTPSAGGVRGASSSERHGTGVGSSSSPSRPRSWSSTTAISPSSSSSSPSRLHRPTHLRRFRSARPHRRTPRAGAARVWDTASMQRMRSVRRTKKTETAPSRDPVSSPSTTPPTSDSHQAPATWAQARAGTTHSLPSAAPPEVSAATTSRCRSVRVRV
ncbi:hypothetical protein B0H14DRAFT_2800021, partial [Mycena olivaceomarginata]